MINILDFTLEELQRWMEDNNQKKFRAKQVLDWIYNEHFNFNEMKNIPQGTIRLLESNFYVGLPRIVKEFISKDKDTYKFLFEYNDGNLIESVVMKYNHGNSICVSTQVGCQMGCKFCASTIGGMVRNLTSGEMIGQILAAQNRIKERISNVVLMGSGEPLQNYDNVIKFIRSINAEYGLNISQRHVTLSTCGIVPKIKKLAEENLQITLAVSLHAPNDELRKQIMPIANKYSVNEIIDACKFYNKISKKRITFEYTLINDFNDGYENAIELITILKNLSCHVNLIPINNVVEKKYKRSCKNNINNFRDTLLKNNIQTTIRREMGEDINAACGQLRRKYINEENKE